VSFLGRIFGTDKAINNIVDKEKGLITQLGGFVGNLKYTDEERAEAQERTRNWGLKQLEALEPFKVMQRLLSAVIIMLWFFVGVTALYMIATDHKNLNKLLEFAFSDYVFWPAVSVVSLYFTGGVVESVTRGIKK
tara:strand:+ start:2414 stop:2818 length:405 start_codon:yes stop_codon:yes gene_type:complete